MVEGIDAARDCFGIVMDDQLHAALGRRPVAQGGRFCDQREFDLPFIHEFKLAGTYSLPYGVDFGAVLQSYAGLERVITWTPAASVFPNGQRTQSQTIVLNEPGSLFGERWDQLDVNFKKNIRYGNKVHTFQLDVFSPPRADWFPFVADE